MKTHLRIQRWVWPAMLSALMLAPPFAGAATVGPVTDPIGVIKIHKGAPIVIGGYCVLSGPDTALRLDEKRAVEIAIKNIGGKLLGHPVALDAEDDQCTAEGGQTAATKLASTPNIVIVLGPGCSSAATLGAPILWQAGIVNIGTASTAPSLTAPDRKPQYDGFVRTVFSDDPRARRTPITSIKSPATRPWSRCMTAVPMRSSSRQ
jgi:branched-chain amino acid transport system substrate-binding protein